MRVQCWMILKILMIHKEDFIHMEEEMNKVLSGLEKQVLALYLDGQSYQEISDELNRQVKSVIMHFNG